MFLNRDFAYGEIVSIFPEKSKSFTGISLKVK